MTQMDITSAPLVTTAGPADAPGMAALHAAALESLGQQPWPAEAFEDILNLPVTLGMKICAGDRLLAFLLAQAAGGEADLLTIATAPDMRRQGLAKRLMTALLARCSSTQVHSINLEVHAGNRAAAGLYSKIGFQVVGERPNYYKDIRTGQRHDAILMRWSTGPASNKTNNS